MFSALLRTQLLATARVARPASRNLSALAASRVVPTATRMVASRTFTQTAVAAREGSRNPPSNIVYLANLPWSTTEEELRELASEFGQVEEVRLASSPDGRPRGFAHITFASQEQAEGVVNSALEEPLHLNGRDLFADFAARRHDAQAPQPINKLYFQGFEGDEEALRQVLAEYNDQIVSIFFLRDTVTGQNLQNGFVEFETTPQASTVLDSFADSDIFKLTYARPKREKRSNDRSDRNDRRPQRYDNDRARGGHYTNRAWQPRDD